MTEHLSTSDAGGSRATNGSSTECPVQARHGKSSDSAKKAIPQGSGTFFSIIDMKRYGYKFYGRKAQELKSSVFEMSLYGSRVVVLDWKGISSFRDCQKVVKEPNFGMLIFNQEILPNHMPAIFCNGKEHEIKKDAAMKFVDKLVNSAGLDFILTLVRSEILRFNSLNYRLDFEKCLSECMGNVISTIFLGQTLPSEDMDLWLSGVLITSKPWFWTEAKFVNAFKSMYSCVKNSPRVVQLLADGSIPGLSEDDLIKSIIFMLVFNAHGGLKNLATSCVATIQNLSKTDLDSMREEAKQLYRSGRIEVQKKTPLIEGFVFEMLRLFCPAPSVFARATDDFVLESTSGNFLIPKGQLLQGNIHESNRDSAVFDDPHVIDVHRYEKNPSLSRYIFTFGGFMDVVADVSNHKCPGQTLTVNILKALVANLVFCDLEFAEVPVWTGQDMKRLAGSDKPLRVSKFHVRELPH